MRNILPTHRANPFYPSAIIRHIVLLFICVWGAADALAQTTFTTSGTYVVPAGVSSITVECWGGGGAGGGCTSSNHTSGGGGAGGAYKTAVVSVMPGQMINYVVGAGGVPASAANGGNGGSSVFLSVVAAGGEGGKVGTGIGGQGAGGATTLGDFNGGAGAAGLTQNYGGAAGGGAGNGGDGGDGVASTGGAGGAGSIPGGSGAGGQTVFGDGISATTLGGGGGGAFNGNGANSSVRTGGSGFRGQITIYSCAFILSSTTATSPLCVGASSSVTLNGTASGLPAGTYTVKYDVSAPNAANGVTATMTVTTPGTGTFSTGAFANAGNTTITITNLNNGSCSSPQSANNTATILVVADPVTPTATKSPNAATVCAGATLSLASVTDNGGGTGNCNIEYRYDNGSGFTAWSTMPASFAAVAGTNTIEIHKVCDGANCNTSGSSSYSWTVVADPAVPTATKSPNVASVCAGQMLSVSSVTDNGGGTGNCNIEYRYNTGSGFTAWSTMPVSFAAVAGTNTIEIHKVCDGSDCNTSNTSSYTWTVVADPAAPTAAKSPNTATVCAGQMLSLSGVTDNGGGTGNCNIEYRYDNGSGFTAWSTMPASFAAVAGTNTIEIHKVCDGANCNTSGSSSYSWTVVADPAVPTATKSPNVASVCAGQMLSVSSVTDNGGGTGNCNIEYRYNTGSGFTAWSTMPVSFAAVAGTNTIEIHKVCDGSDCNTSNTSSYSWTVAADPAAPTATKSPNMASVCAGATLSLVSVTDNGGGTGNCNIEYRYNTGSGFTAWSTMPVSFAAVTGTNTIEIHKVCDGSDCNTSNTSSYTWTVVADPAAPTAAKSPNTATVCAGQILSLSSVTDNGGGTGNCNIEYRYDNGSGFTAWSTMPASFAAVAGTNTIEIHKVCDGADCNTSNTSSYSWTVVADPAAPTATKSPNVASVCVGASLSLVSVTDNGGGTGNCNIEYRYDTGSGFTAWSAMAPSFAAVTGTNIIEIHKVCDGADCNTSNTSSYSWTVAADPAAPTATKSPNVASVCVGATLSLVSVTDNGGGAGNCNLEYRYDTGSGFSAWSTTLPSFAAVTGTNTIEMHKVCDGADCNTSNSSSYSWTVLADPAAPTATKSPNTASVCAGQMLSLSGVTDNGGGTGNCNIEYRYDTGSGFTAWSNTVPNFASVAGANTIEMHKVCDGADCNTSASTVYSWMVAPSCTVLSGKLIWEGNRLTLMTGVNGALVTLSGDAMGSDITGLPGTYSLAAGVGGNFTITPAKNRPMPQALNGVTSADASRIQMHVNGTLKITDPYKLIAADVNKSNSVTSADVALVQQALLGNPEAQLYFINTSWRFVPKAYVFPIPQTPWGFPESINISGTGNISGQDFIGVKTGDVNSTANPVNAPGLPVSNLVWTIQDQVLVEDAPIVVEFCANNYTDLLALQFGIQFDRSKLELQQIETLEGSPLQVTNFGYYPQTDNEIRVFLAIADTRSMAQGSPAFRLRFKSLQNGGQLSQALQLNDAVLKGEAYSADFTPHPVSLGFKNLLSGINEPVESSFRLLQNRPNPFYQSTTLGFVLPQAADVQIRVYTISGRLLLSEKGSFERGYNEHTLHLEAFDYDGILYCELLTPFGTLTQKMTTFHK